MSDFFEYDPLTGMRTDFEYNPDTGEATFNQTQDVTALLEFNKILANDSMTDKGIKEGWWLYAKVPPIVILQMRKKGIDFYNRDHFQRVMQEINSFYPALKVTQKNEGTKARIIVGG